VAARRETVDAGLQVMADGGNAVDAAVSMGFTAAVVEPTEASIGGSGFLLAQDPASANAWSIEFPPRAPLRASPDMYEPVAENGAHRLLGTGHVRDDANATGCLAPCVPGAVAGLCLAHARFGTLPLARLVEPAIEVAEAGFEIDAYFTLQALDNLEALRASAQSREIFLRDGLPPNAPFAARPEGDPPRLKQPDLARTLRAIAADGADSFYRGDIAEAIQQAFEQCGGLISRTDFEAYEATIERPLRASYRGWSVLGPCAPSGGWTVLQALQILDQTEFGLEVETAGALHVLAEALQLAFAHRYRSAGDAKAPETEAADVLLSEAHARELAGMIRPDRKSPLTESIPPLPWQRLACPNVGDTGHGTTHFCVVDADGRMVSCTLTAGNTFGSKTVAEGTGVLLDSGMAWFDPRPGAANSIAPWKRPLVNMAPLLLLGDGGARVALGAAGGRRIISAITQVVSGIVDHGLSIQEAISAPRLDASDRTIRLSERFPRGTAEGLRALGHEISMVQEEHLPFSYEFARPAGAAVDEVGLRSGGIHPFAQGFVAGS
jgi:gamma-glutamyltranspeptidase/glutathione hydrolase